MDPLKIKGLPGYSHLERHGGVTLTFGAFDAMHLGQQKALRHLVSRSRSTNSRSAVIVFRPRPLDTVTKGPPKPYLTARDQAVQLIRDCGVDYVGVLKFTEQLTLTLAPEYLERLAARIPIRELWLPPHASVGRGPTGSLPAVADTAKNLGFRLKLFAETEDSPTPTSVLGRLHQRDMRGLASELGRPYQLPTYIHTGTPVPGTGLVSHPILTPDLLWLPPDGAYSVMVTPAVFGDVSPATDVHPGRAALTFETDRRPFSPPRAKLIADARAGWSSLFALVDFIDAHAPSRQDLWAWACGVPLTTEREQGNDG
jgi:FAD synthase